MTLHRFFNWAIAAAIALLMGLTWHLDDHASDMTRSDAERAAKAEEALQEYKAAWETVNPSPPTFMGEPVITTPKEDRDPC